MLDLLKFKLELSFSRKVFLLLVSVVLVQVSFFAQPYPGYTLYAPNGTKNTYLIDLNNTTVKTWTHNINGGYSYYLLPDGNLMRSALSSNSSLNSGGAQGIIQKVDKNNNIVWQYTYSSNSVRAHHDFCPMPNGNVLLIAWEVKSAAESVQAGLNHSAVLWPDHIIEVQPVGSNGGNIVWKWHAWDHLIQDYDPAKNNYGVVANHPELLDINVGSTSGDWMHVNGISYNPQTDQIVFSSHNLHEIYVIDHSTTTEEAAGHTGGNRGKGGDFLYRWGKPSNYRAPGSQVFKVVHCGVWIPAGLPGAGHLMAFNNREGQGTSMIVEIVPPKDSLGNYIWIPGTAFGPASPIWSYTASGFYSNHLGGNQRLPNGNTLIAESTSGELFEVDSLGNIVWSYSRTFQIVRVLRYGLDYPGIQVLLPVELTSFSSSLDNKNVLLRWTTASETNNSHFEIERNSNGEDFKKIGSVLGNGTTIISNEYSFIDINIPDGILSYRLKQIDFDGSFAYSKVIEINNNNLLLNMSLSQNYPNPFSSNGYSADEVISGEGNAKTAIEFFVKNEGRAILKIYNSLGELVKTLFDETAIANKSYKIYFSANGLRSGIYFYTLSSNGNTITKKMIIMK